MLLKTFLQGCKLIHLCATLLHLLGLLLMSPFRAFTCWVGPCHAQKMLADLAGICCCCSPKNDCRAQQRLSSNIYSEHSYGHCINHLLMVAVPCMSSKL